MKYWEPSFRCCSASQNLLGSPTSPSLLPLPIITCSDRWAYGRPEQHFTSYKDTKNCVSWRITSKEEVFFRRDVPTLQERWEKIVVLMDFTKNTQFSKKKTKIYLYTYSSLLYFILIYLELVLDEMGAKVWLLSPKCKQRPNFLPQTVLSRKTYSISKSSNFQNLIITWGQEEKLSSTLMSSLLCNKKTMNEWISFVTFLWCRQTLSYYSRFPKNIYRERFFEVRGKLFALRHF